MKIVVQGLILAVLLVLLGERSYAAYRWKQEAETAIRLANQQASDASHWLRDPVITVQGKPLSRADLLDILLAKALQPVPAANRSVR